MYCLSKQCFLGAALTMAGFSYYLYIPVLEGMEESLKVWSISIRFKVIHQFAYFLDMIGLVDEVSATKNMVQYVLEDKEPPHVLGIKNFQLEIRERMINKTFPEQTGVMTKDYSFDGVPVRLYRPVSAKTPLPCVIYLHGGGWTVASVDAYDEVPATFADKSGYVFVSVDYRLAPEYSFPAQFDDCYKASRYFLTHAKEFGCDENKIGIAGDSAGGNLAAAVSQKMAAVNDVPKFRFQWLIYPALQAIDFQLPAYISNDEAQPYVMGIVDMIVFWSNYIGIVPTPDVISAALANRHVTKKVKQSYGKYVDYKQLPSRYHSVVSKLTQSDTSDEKLAKRIEDIILNPFFAPLMSKANLSKVPPAFILNAEYDVLRDDGLLYALKLRKFGVEVEEYTAPNSTHCFMLFSSFFPRFEHFDVATEKFIKFAQKHFR